MQCFLCMQKMCSLKGVKGDQIIFLEHVSIYAFLNGLLPRNAREYRRIRRHAALGENDDTLFVNNVNRSLYEQAACSVQLRDGFTFVNQQRKLIMLFFNKCFMRLHIGWIDAENDGVFFVKFSIIIA